jgi:cytoskeletal protein RodZ
MNQTRIEIAAIPNELPAPHFDDEATIVSARQVVPIAEARIAERSRTLFSIIPILLGAAVFGALGAIGVNYFENYQSGHALVSGPRTESSQPMSQAPATQQQGKTQANSGTEVAGGALAPSQSSSPASEVAQPPRQTEAQTTDATAGQPPVDSKNGDNPAPPNSASSPEPGKLIRKRRVRPPIQGKSDNSGKDKRGAGRIQEIFNGANP